MYQAISTQLENNILIITINRPDKMNALNQTVMAELALAVDEIYSNHDIKGAVITGAGEKAFVAGADIAEFLSLSPKQGEELAKKGHVIFQRIENSPKPIVAAVNGFALGGGCELAMACHFRIASENARFGQPEVNLGLIPGYGGTQRLTQLVGKGKALELMMTGDMLTAPEALSWGLVNHVVKLEELLPKTIAILRKIQTKAPLAIARVVKCANAALDKDQDGYDTEIQEFAACFATKDLQEGAAAFTEKRQPNFTGA
ncbi:enoyl-CoA hydratase/isomerase family protein [Chitinophaga nivalis]|uniref:Enoyl-CoA hydratase-related protein n=1 Tax=Chitinophaga nivalis TaxID=2991709 RepID=A0ABT3IUR2_9BACT|nr:enoyl-CoA hydratase-related protein [Chitinophaga nivalis]MCW3462860.1 enoyl-CoA hydratase-related protein [Chitinophaga nivalis]MCW3487450.1 enoyl-CoA hydratase-related protein [Chitinophaga nivalis]